MKTLILCFALCLTFSLSAMADEGSNAEPIQVRELRFFADQRDAALNRFFDFAGKARDNPSDRAKLQELLKQSDDAKLAYARALHAPMSSDQSQPENARESLETLNISLDIARLVQISQEGDLRDRRIATEAMKQLGIAYEDGIVTVQAPNSGSAR